MQKKIYLLSVLIFCSFLKLLAQPGLVLPDQTATCGETLALPVTVTGFTDMQGIQFSINWDTSMLVFERDMRNGDSGNLDGTFTYDSTNVNKGQFSYIWFNSNALSLNDGDTILTIVLKVSGGNFSSTEIRFSETPVFVEGTRNNSAISLAQTNATLTITDNEPPVLICPADQDIEVSEGSTTAVVSNIAPDTEDNCGVDSVLYQLSGATIGSGTGSPNGQSFNIGTTLVTYRVKDYAGNETECFFEVRVDEPGNTDRVVVSGTALTVSCGTAFNLPLIVSNFDSITSLQFSLDWDPAKLSFFNIDVFNLADLDSGNFDLSQTGSGKLILDWSNASPQSLADGTALFIVRFTPLVDLNNELLSIDNVEVNRNGATFPATGNAATLNTEDNTPPVLNCPADQDLTAGPGQLNLVVNDIAPEATDNCGVSSISYELSGATTGSGSGDASGLIFNIGTTTVTYTAADAEGLSVLCSFTVNITGDIPSGFTLSAQSANASCDADDIPIDINVARFDSIAGTQFSVNWDPGILRFESIDTLQFVEAAGFDLIDLANGRIGYSWFNARTATLPDGTSLFRLHFSSISGGTSPVTFTGTPTPIEINHRKDGAYQVIPLDSIVLTSGSVVVEDVEAPEIICPNDTLIIIEPGASFAMVDGLDPLISDNCGITTLTYELSGATIGSGTATASGQFFNVGTTTLTYTVVDGGGNTKQCSSKVTLSAPGAIEVTPLGGPAICGDEQYKVDILVDSFTNTRGLQFSIGWDQNILAFDSIGDYGLEELNNSNFSTVIVNSGKLSFAWFDNGVDGETLSNGSVLFSIYFKVSGDADATTTVFIGDDPVPKEGNINTSSGRRIVPVIGNSTEITIVGQPVFINCPETITVVPDSACQAIVSWTEPSLLDNCAGVVIVSSTHNPGDVFTNPVTTVTYTAEDVLGNRVFCSFDVVLTGLTPIAFNNFPGNITVNATEGQCGANIGWLPPTASGGCDDREDIAVVCSHEPNDFFPVGITNVICTATDSSGQSVSDTFTVTVIDNQDLVVICPTDIEVQADGTVIRDEAGFINSVTSDTCGNYMLTFNEITAFDNCSPITISQVRGPRDSSIFTFGSTMMEFVVSDTSGNSRSCTFQITISETRSITASTLDDPNCAGASLRLSVDTLANATYEWMGPGGFVVDEQNPVIPDVMIQNSGTYAVKLVTENGCILKDSVTVGILSSPEIVASGTDLSCTGAADTLRLFAVVTNGIPVQSYEWFGPAGFTSDSINPIISATTSAAAGEYIVTATSGNGCTDTDTVMIDLTGMAMPQLTASKDGELIVNGDTICTGTPFNLSGTTYNGVSSYFWSAEEGAGLPDTTDRNALLVSPTVAGSYTYRYAVGFDGSCTSDTASFELVVLGGAGSIALSSNAPLECAASNQTLDLLANGGESIVSYTWTGPDAFSSSEQNPSIPVSNDAGGTYYLEATSGSGCTFSDSITVSVTVQGAPPVITVEGGTNNICEGNALALTTPEVLGATYNWIGPNGFTTTNQNVVIPNATIDNAGAYQLRITENGCTSAPATGGPIEILTEPLANDDVLEAVVNQPIVFNPGENDQVLQGVGITTTIISGASNGELAINNDGTFTYNPATNFVGMDQMAYEICYEDCADLCSMATITIRTEFDRSQCIVPTFISPNGDGFNDVLFISCVSDPPKQGSELIIWNEWGSEVFRESPYQNNWQGTYKGKDLPDGTYYYVYKEDSDDTNPKKGYFTLFR